MAEAELLSLDEALERHAGEWRAIAERRGSAFISPEWVECWQRQYGTAAEIRVAVVVDDAGALRGLMPFAVESRGYPRAARVAGASLADWIHPVAEPGEESEIALAACAALAEHGPSWGALVFDNVDADGPLARIEPGDGGGRPLRRRERSSTVLPYAELPGTYDEYLAGRSSSFRRQLRRFDRRLAREAQLELRQTEDPGDLEADLETFFRLHFARWEGRGGSSLQPPGVRAFHLDFAAEALGRGWLRLLTLEADGEPIASFYGWRLGERYAFYQAGFDQAWSKFSVGLVLHGRVIERAIAEGAGEYDMLLGAEPYKLRFCDSLRHAVTVIFTRRYHPAGLVVGAEIGARRMVRRLPDDLRDRVRGALAGVERLLPTGRRR
jgi:CelD/BcsL family acetyltransferase involved in cellulose biosynthesis